MYKDTTDFLMLILYPAVLLKLLIRLHGYFMGL